jgi:type II secretory pathway pseudopilin PulG
MACHYGLLERVLIVVVIIILLLGSSALPVIVIIVAVAAAAQQEGKTQTYRSRYPHDVAPCTSLR